MEKEGANEKESHNTISVYNEKTVAITFDDGPKAKSTTALLDGLKEKNVVATFFVVGENIEGNETIIRRMQDEGHQIGNHTYYHKVLNELSKEQRDFEINRTNELIYNITGKMPEYLRPPCGEWNKEYYFEYDMKPVFWTVDPLDWKRRDVSGIVKDVVSNVEDGSIILLHDIYDTSVAAALEIIDELKARGFIFVTVEEILIS